MRKTLITTLGVAATISLITYGTWVYIVDAVGKAIDGFADDLEPWDSDHWD